MPAFNELIVRSGIDRVTMATVSADLTTPPFPGVESRQESSRSDSRISRNSS